MMKAQKFNRCERTLAPKWAYSIQTMEHRVLKKSSVKKFESFDKGNLTAMVLI